MEPFSFIKFWRLTSSNRRETKPCDHVIRSSAALQNEEDTSEGDDSFFELELSLTDFNCRNRQKVKISEQSRTETAVSPSPTDHVDSGPKPQSPISLLKQNSKFRAFSFKKSMERTETPAKTECAMRRSLDVRFEMDDGREPLAALPRETSFRITAGSLKSQRVNDTVSEESSSSSSCSSSSSSKRFFSLIKPLYSKPSKPQSSKQDHVSSVASPASSPAMVVGKEKQRSLSTGIWVVRKHLGKSRSSAAAVGVASPASRINESLIVQQDGIQSAILHCKRSFQGSRESSTLSRSTSDSSSQEKLSISSLSEDSYVFSRISSGCASERSGFHEKIDKL